MSNYSNFLYFFIAMVFWLVVGSYNIYDIEQNRFSPPEVDDAYNMLLRYEISKDMHNAYAQPALRSLHEQLSTPPPDAKSESARYREKVYFRVFHQYNIAWNAICKLLTFNTKGQKAIENAYYRTMYVGLFIFGIGIFCLIAKLINPLTAIILIFTISCTTPIAYDLGNLIPIGYGYFWMTAQNFCIGICFLIYSIMLMHNKYLLLIIPILSTFACFLHHFALVLLVPAIPALFVSCRESFHHPWKSLHIYFQDLITFLTVCILAYFTYIKLVNPLPYLRELAFPYPVSFAEKMSLISKSLVKFSSDFWIFLEHFIPFAAPPSWAVSNKFAIFLLLFSLMWSLWIFRKNITRFFLTLCIFSGVLLSLAYHPHIAPHTPVDRLFCIWFIIVYAVFIKTCISFCRFLTKKSAYPRALRIMFSSLGCILIAYIVSYQIPSLNAYRNFVIERHAPYYYDADKIRTFMSMSNSNNPIGYAYETDAYVSLLYGGFSSPVDLLYITKDDDLKTKYPSDNVNLVAASNNIARIISSKQYVKLTYDFNPGKYTVIFDNTLQNFETVYLKTNQLKIDFKIPPRSKQYRIVFTLDNPEKSISFSTNNGFVILRGFLLHPKQEHFWPWGTDLELTSQIQNKTPFSYNFRDRFLDFGPDLRKWRVLDDTTGLIFFSRK